MTLVTDLDTPSLVLDRAQMEENIRAMANRMHTAGVALRPHFKTSKMIEVAKLQIAAGAVGFTCATLAEVEALLDAGITDLFWAHGPVGVYCLLNKKSASLSLPRPPPSVSLSLSLSLFLIPSFCCPFPGSCSRGPPLPGRRTPLTRQDLLLLVIPTGGSFADLR